MEARCVERRVVNRALHTKDAPVASDETRRAGRGRDGEPPSQTTLAPLSPATCC